MLGPLVAQDISVGKSGRRAGLTGEQAEPSIANPAALLVGVALVDRPGRDDDAPAGEPDLLESDFMRELLAAAGIADKEVARIEGLVRSIFSSQQQDQAELRLIRDAVQLVCRQAPVS
jgi:hypothetical protein